MSKAEERALKAYPVKIAARDGYDENLRERKGFVKGYEQAEKDNELTWKDLKLLQNISHGIFAETANGSAEFYQVYPTEQSFFEEVLKRFKDLKK